MQTALITGGSSGIGLELAHVMAEHGHNLVLVARDKENLAQAKKDIESKWNVSVAIIVLDLSRPGSAKRLYTKTRDSGIEILVNNAGFGLKGDFFGGNLERNVEMAQLNMVSLMELTHYFGKDFVAKDKGRILNVASIVSFMPGPKQPVYFASKAFVRSFSRALAYNLRNTGVTVTVLHPGITKTNFFKVANAATVTGGASPQSVARLGYKAMMAGKIETTHGTANRIITNFLIRIIPYRYQAYIIDRAADA